MMKKIDEKKKDKTGDIGVETFSFIKKKTTCLFPELLVAWVIGALLLLIFWDKGKMSYLRLLCNSIIGDVACLNMYGITYSDYRAGRILFPVWYVSAMLISMTVLYPLLRKWRSIMIHIAIPFVSLIILGILLQNDHSILGPFEWTGIMYKGLLRGFADIGLGAICYEIFCALNKKHIKWTVLGRILITSIKWSAYVITIIIMEFGDGSFGVIVIALFCIAIVLSFTEWGIDTPFFQSVVFKKASYCSLVIFLSHGAVANIMSQLMFSGTRELHTVKIYIYYMLLVTGLALVVGVISWVLKKHTRKLRLYIHKAILV